MASRREEKERLRAERMAAQQHDQSAARRRIVAGYLLAGLLAAAVLVGLVVAIASGGGGDGPAPDCDNAQINAETGVFEGLDPDCREGTAPPEIQFGDLNESAQRANCTVSLNQEEQGNEHVSDTAKVTYKSKPPTSGKMTEETLADGAYTTPLSYDTSSSPDVLNFVHSIEHSRVAIQYDPNLPEADQLALKGVFDDSPGGVILIPDAELTGAVTVTTWLNQVACPTYNEMVLDVIRNFRDTYRGNGPEAGAPFTP